MFALLAFGAIYTRTAPAIATSVQLTGIGPFAKKVVALNTLGLVCRGLFANEAGYIA
jgi:hypothetical protein